MNREVTKAMTGIPHTDHTNKISLLHPLSLSHTTWQNFR